MFCLFMACALTGQHPADCWGVALTESNLGQRTNHAAPTVHGLMGVDSRYSPLPAWALDTTVGGSIGGALAIRAMKAEHGKDWALFYKCKRASAKARKPVCVEKAKELMDLIARLRPAREV